MEVRDRKPVRPAPGDRGAWGQEAAVRAVVHRPGPSAGDRASADQPSVAPPGPATVPRPADDGPLPQRPGPAPDPNAPLHGPGGFRRPAPVITRSAPVARVASPAHLAPLEPRASGGGPGRGVAPADPSASAPVPGRGPAPAPRAPLRPGFGFPALRRNVCPHFYVTGPRGAVPATAPHVLKALARQSAHVSRCQVRGGVHLDEGYVGEVCLTPRCNQCVFYEDHLERP